MTLPQMDGLAAELFERHGRVVRGYFRALTGSVELAEDLAQEVFLRVVGQAERYEARERERAWLLRIARNLLTDHRRRVSARPVMVATPVDAAVEASQDVRLDLRQALAELPETERDAFLMAEIGGLTYAEIGDALNLTLPAVRSVIFRARLQLRNRLVPPAPLPPSRGLIHDD